MILAEFDDDVLRRFKIKKTDVMGQYLECT